MTITWADGTTEEYDFTHQETREGEVHFWTEYPGSLSMTTRHDEHWIPLASIRERTARDKW